MQADHRVVDLPVELTVLKPSPVRAPALPTPLAPTLADFTLFSLAWEEHRAVAGLVLRPTGALFVANTLPAPASGSEYQLGLYALDQWRLQPSLIATLDLRFEHRLAGSTHLRPRAELLWTAAADTSVRARYGHDQRSPLLGERGYDAAVANVNPLAQREQSEVLELAADHRLGGDSTVRAMAYSWTVRDVPVTTNALPQVHFATVRARGVELSADHAWVTGARVRGSAFMQDAVQGDGPPLPGVPQLFGKLLLSTPLPWAGLSLAYEWVYGGSCVGPDGSELDKRAMSNLTLGSATLAEGVDMSLSVLNLFDAREPLITRDSSGSTVIGQDGRNVRLLVAYRF